MIPTAHCWSLRKKHRMRKMRYLLMKAKTRPWIDLSSSLSRNFVAQARSDERSQPPPADAHSDPAFTPQARHATTGAADMTASARQEPPMPPTAQHRNAPKKNKAPLCALFPSPGVEVAHECVGATGSRRMALTSFRACEQEMEGQEVCS